MIDLPRDPETGKRRQRWGGRSRTRKETEAKLAEALNELRGGTFVEPSNVTTGEFLRSWLPGLETRGLRPSTRTSYEMLVEKHLIPRIGGIPLQALTPGI